MKADYPLLQCVAGVARRNRLERCRKPVTFGVRLCVMHLGRARMNVGDGWDGRKPGAFDELYRAVGAQAEWL